MAKLAPLKNSMMGSEGEVELCKGRAGGGTKVALPLVVNHRYVYTNAAEAE